MGDNAIGREARELAAWLRDSAITAEDACKADGDNEVYAEQHRKMRRAADLLDRLSPDLEEPK